MYPINAVKIVLRAMRLPRVRRTASKRPAKRLYCTSRHPCTNEKYAKRRREKSMETIKRFANFVFKKMYDLYSLTIRIYTWINGITRNDETHWRQLRYLFIFVRLASNICFLRIVIVTGRVTGIFLVVVQGLQVPGRK